MQVNKVYENAIKVEAGCTLNIDMETLNNLAQSLTVAIYLHHNASLRIHNYISSDVKFNYILLISAENYNQVRCRIYKKLL